MITLEKILGALTGKENLYRSGRNFTALETEVNAHGTQINNLDAEVDAHKAEVITKVVSVTEPYGQTTKTTVNLGFRPKLVIIEALITDTKYFSTGKSDSIVSRVSFQRASNSVFANINNNVIALGYDLNNALLGSVVFTATGIEINWNLVGTLTGASGNRVLTITTITH